MVSLEGALRSAGSRYEAVAATLGARPTTVLRRVTLPLVLPGLASGAVLSFARSLGEFGATLTFAGSLQGVTRTLPLEIYLQRETDADAAVALSLLLVVVAVVVVGLSYRGPAPAGSGGSRRRPAQQRGCRHDVHARRRPRRPPLRRVTEPGAGRDGGRARPQRGGKSTLLSVISGLLRPDTGRAEVNGRVLFELGGPACTPGPRRTAAEPPCWPRIPCCFRT